MSALLLDVGNTRLKWGIAEDEVIQKTGNIAMLTLREQGLGVLTTRLPRKVDAVMASNVAGRSFATRLAGWIGAHCNRDVQFARTTRTAFGVTNSYGQPRRMGVDRWVAMIGAWTELEAACLIVDAGTAVTIDALADDGQHLGGQIIPGVALMTRALASETSDIPLVIPKQSEAFEGMDMFAHNTGGALIGGALNAVTGGIERAMRTLQSEHRDAALVLTGGDAPRILKSLERAPLHRPHVVLQGLLQMHRQTSS